MSLSHLNQLKRAEQLFDAGELDEALEIFNDWSQFEGLILQQKKYYQFLKGMILSYRHNSEEIIKFGEQILKEGQKQNDYLQTFDGLYFIIFGEIFAEYGGKMDDADKLLEKIEASFKLIPRISNKILVQREARLKLLKGHIYKNSGNIDLAEICIEWVLGAKRELGNSFEIVWANHLLGQIMFLAKSKTNLAMKYFKKAIALAKEIKFNHYWIAICHGFCGLIYSSIGEIDNSLEHYMKASKLIKGFKSNFMDAMLLNNLGSLYCLKGEYDLSLEYLEKSLLIFKIQSTGVENCLDSLINVALEKGDTELAQKYFQRLENMYNQTKGRHVKLIYRYNRALMLKRSSRIRDKAKAEELFKQVVNTTSFSYEVIINAHIHLCDLLLAEFNINNDSEVLDELNHYIDNLLTIAEKSHSYLVFCETFILQAKIGLVNYDIKAARRFLSQAQKIAENHQIKRLAMKISYEHDKLLKQTDMWEKLKESNASLSERWELAGLKEQMENMVRKRITESPKISEEKPISIFIITEGGSALLSHSFIDQKTFESHLFGGFLITIDYFIRKIFSEGLDRAVFGDYTLLMRSIQPFIITYIFKGDSYYAHQKIIYFIELIQKEQVIWQELLKSFKVNQSINLKDIPLLESLITEIFITKNY
ncbi:MAG: tetratricopeptide repeat protein [Promethearchaeota archaeon]|nr:MAG: tetratricopeptide repeat protein [Candidatus Lokiarchaeota archaeon]